MSENKFDAIIVNLKVIAQVPRNRRLRTTSNGFFTLEDNNLFVPIKRALFGEGRDKLIRDIKSLLMEIKSQIKLLLSSKHIENDDGQNASNAPNAFQASQHQSDEKRAIIEQISCIHRELHRSINGFENLKSTYASDILMVGELEHVIDTVRLFMREIEQKIPDITEKYSAVLLEKDTD